jgi:CRISPR-associated protein Cmr2
MTARYFHFTLGPVQGFVSQARRTRDFWAGSFLLSWLAGVAMHAVKRQGGTIRFPAPDEKFMAAILDGGTGPHQGGIPNRFVAEVKPGFSAGQVVEDVRAAWRALAETVYAADLKLAENTTTRGIWDRQIGGFWEVSWAIGDSPEESGLLDRRKNWRSHLPPEEPGMKCMMMDGWQELSGEKGPATGPTDKFWQRVRSAGSKGMKTDLRADEHLCAVAFVKRRFARYFRDLMASLPSGLAIKGWSLPLGVPSVAYMAAAPWLAKALRKANDADLRRFHDAAYELTGGYGEMGSNIACVTEADAPKRWKALDGNVFFENILDNARIHEDQAQAREVKGLLRRVRDGAGLGPVSPFYALLLMDGDSLGANMSDPAKQDAITQSLAAFTDKAPEIVRGHDGFLIYAGGDDVLALVTLERALSCAAALRGLYMKCFAGKDIATSLSGAIEYAHIKMPLGKVLHDAHDLLDSVAKDGRGRDAIAVRVWKPGGKAVEWAMPWEVALQDGRLAIEQLVRKFRGDDPNMKAAAGSDESGQFASRFFYRIRELFDVLNPAPGESPLLGKTQRELLITAEYLSSGSAATKDSEEARRIIHPLLEQCEPVVRDLREPDKKKWRRRDRLEADGALLVRFLAHKGIER